MAAAAAVCEGDCDANGVITRVEIGFGVDVGLGRADLGECSGVDIDGDETVTVDDLVSVARARLNPCGPLGDLSRFAATWSAELAVDMPVEEGAGDRASGRVYIANGLGIGLENGIFDRTSLRAAEIADDGTIRLAGSHVEGDLFMQAFGEAAIETSPQLDRIELYFEYDEFVGPRRHVRVNAILKRPTSGTPATFNRDYTVALNSFYSGNVGTFTLHAAVPANGIGTCTPVGASLVEAGECEISPYGDFSFGGNYAPHGETLFLQGALTPSGTGSGGFIIGYVPPHLPYGTWQAGD